MVVRGGRAWRQPKIDLQVKVAERELVAHAGDAVVVNAPVCGISRRRLIILDIRFADALCDLEVGRALIEWHSLILTDHWK